MEKSLLWDFNFEIRKADAKNILKRKSKKVFILIFSQKFKIFIVKF